MLPSPGKVMLALCFHYTVHTLRCRRRCQLQTCKKSRVCVCHSVSRHACRQTPKFVTRDEGISKRVFLNLSECHFPLHHLGRQHQSVPIHSHPFSFRPPQTPAATGATFKKKEKKTALQMNIHPVPLQSSACPGADRWGTDSKFWLKLPVQIGPNDLAKLSF